MEYYYQNWKKVASLNMSNAEIEALIDGYIIYHWNSLNIGGAYGIRAAFLALAELGCNRNNREVLEVSVSSSYCFAMAVEYICAVPHLRERLLFEVSFDDTILVAKSQFNKVTITGKATGFDKVEDILQAHDDILFDVSTELLG